MAQGNFGPLLVFLNNAAMVKAVTLAFCSIQQHFIRDVHAKFFISQSPDIEQNSDWCTSDFPISGQSLIQGNCYNSRTSDDIDMKLEPVIWQEKQNNFKNLKMTSCRKIVKSVLFFQLTVNLEQSKSRILVAQSAKRFFINSNLLSSKS